MPCVYLQVNGTKIFKSGTDFRCFSEIEITFDNGLYEINSKKHEITKDVPENPEIKAVVEKYLGTMHFLIPEPNVSGAFF